jgi:glucose/arabinose dehydrogenase
VARVKSNFVSPPALGRALALALICSLTTTAWRAPVSAASGSGVALKLVAEGLTAPSVLVPFNDGSGRLLLAEQGGPLSLMSKDGKREPFLDLRPLLIALNKGFDERGVLGVALHPKFRANGKFYVFYSAPKRASAPADWDNTAHVSEFKYDLQTKTASLSSERLVLEIDKPYFNHNGGRIAFGPDGFLYIGVGDGGNAHDTGKRPDTGNGQNLNTLLGKILRIDVDKGAPYSIPKDNPFADGVKGKPEIFAYGIRNPWGMSFDRGGKHELFASEVGQSAYEEVNIIVNGGNYGWNVKEGHAWFDPKKPLNPSDTGTSTDALGKTFIEPAIVYKNIKVFPQDGLGISVTGGYVYRGKALPKLAGKYVFGDWSRNFGLGQGVLLSATRPKSKGADWTVEVINPSDHPKNLGTFVWAFGEDETGELYVLCNGNSTVLGTSGKIFKLVPEAAAK